MARTIWTFYAAIVLAMHAQSVPIPDGGDLVVVTTEPSTGSPDPTSASTNVSSTTLATSDKPPPPKIYSMHISSDIEFRFAKTLVTSRVANPASISQEVSFSVVLPQDAFITGFVMEIDGKSYRAYVKEKEEAKKAYNEAIEQGLAAAHVAYSARESNSFDVSVNIEPLKKVTFNLTYEELLTRSKGLYHHTVTISPGQIIPDMLVKVHIKEPRTITKLFTPKFSSENKVSDLEDDPCSGDSANSSVCTSGNEVARKQVISPTEAIVEFGPTLEEQKKLAQDKGKGLSGQFEVLYDVERDPSGGEVLVRDGYFVHFFAPTDLQILPKHIVFVLDVSGSMMGRKIDQVKAAMNTILASLQPDDYFNVIVFSSEVTSWDLDKPESDLVTDRDPYFYRPYGETTTTTPEPVTREAVPAYPANKEYIQKALKRINDTQANGGTNINGGLKQAIKTIKQHRELLKNNGDLKARKSIIMFLTDGEANVGESRPDYIISGLSELNTAPQAPIYSLTFGEDGNIDFLKKLSLANSGLARIIYEGADADVQLKRFYHDISSPLLSNITFKYLPKEVDLNSTTKINYHTYYQGGELVVAGRTADKEVQEISGDVSAAARDNDSKQYPVKSLPYQGPHLPFLDDFIMLPPPRENTKTRATTSLERAWAYLTVKQLIDEWEAEKSKKHEAPGENNGFKPLAPFSPQPLPYPPLSTVSPSTDSSTTEAPSTTTKPAETSSTTVSPIPEKPSAKQRALDLALKYSFVTKLTSLVVVKPNATQATEAKRIVSGENAAFIGGASGYGFAAGLAGLPSGSGYGGFIAPQAAGIPAAPQSALYNRVSAGSNFGAPGAAAFFAASYPVPSGLSVAASVPASATDSRIIGGFPGASSAVSFDLVPGMGGNLNIFAPGGMSAGGFPSTTVRLAFNRVRPAFGHSGFPAQGAPPPPRPPPSFKAPSAYPASALSAFSSGIPKRKLSVTALPVPVSVDRIDSLSNVDSADTQALSTHAAEPELLTTNPPTAQSPFEKLNISDVAWLNQEALNNGTIQLDVNGQKKQYDILLNPDASKSANSSTCAAPGIPSGKCRHLSQCVMRAVTLSVEAYLPYQCQLENYLAVCCDEEQQP